MATSLSKSELEAIRHYTDGGYVAVNGELRGDASGDEIVLAQIFQLDAAIEQSVTDKPLTVYRGVDRAYARELEKRGVKAGDIIRDEGFLSTSTLAKVARGFMRYGPGGLMFKIRIPEGSNALDLSPFDEP